MGIVRRQTMGANNQRLIMKAGCENPKPKMGHRVFIGASALPDFLRN
jgi:hypothetical protein